MFTPRTVLKTRVEPCHAYFSRRGHVAQVYGFDRVMSELRFYGADGRKTRADAVEWVHREAERLAKVNATAWRDVRDSKRAQYA